MKGTTFEELPALFADPEFGDRRKAWFFSYVQANRDCEEWMGARLKPPTLPYGCVNIGGKNFAVHRIAYIIHNGVSPGELCVCHTCDNPPCTKKQHLFLGTYADNNRDTRTKGRLRPVRGERAFNARLTEAKVREVRRLKAKGWGDRRIAKKMGVARSTIRCISLGLTWTHVE